MSEQLKTDAAPTTHRATLLDLSPTQLVAGSMAAATAAALGSRLGLVGTITGAAVGSVVSAVAANLYTMSMVRAHEALRWQKLPPRERRAGLHHVPAPAPPDGPNARVRPARSLLAAAAVLFAVATAFLTGLQLATGTDVTGTSLGTRQTTSRLDPGAPTGAEQGRTPAATDPQVTPEPTLPAPAGSSPPDPAGVAEPVPETTDPPDPAAPSATESVPTDPATTGTPTQPADPPSTPTPAG
ncbi:hypothetical protein [Intrasporangium sp.]|uniref:hypothetical protein n=1 Tax=Intrasporangium sp. TaxID=1925024 RepID=UPI00293B3DB3|nr:hypothetical protein [Intrasporangium sp.]MDV3221785.1 hypothetical protein [Intrasporangium sp.]